MSSMTLMTRSARGLDPVLPADSQAFAAVSFFTLGCTSRCFKPVAGITRLRSFLGMCISCNRLTPGACNALRSGSFDFFHTSATEMQGSGQTCRSSRSAHLCRWPHNVPLFCGFRANCVLISAGIAALCNVTDAAPISSAARYQKRCQHLGATLISDEGLLCSLAPRAPPGKSFWRSTGESI